MSTKKKKPARPPRLTSYERALEDAKTRLGKAIDERTTALHKIDALNREIPYLEGIVIALTPPPAAVVDAARPDPYAAQSFKMPPAAAEVSSPMLDQEEYLAKFMPRTGRLTTSVPPSQRRPQPDGTSPDPDEFLRDDGPGQEILS